MTRFLVFIANRLWLIMLLYLLSLMLSSALFVVLEVRSFWDGLWWSVVTSLSIGYGDVVPITAGGRFVGAIFAHFWVFAIIPLVAANIIIRVIEDRHRFTDSEQMILFERVEKIEQLVKQLSDTGNKKI